ncbi:hypothetical protein GCM10029976_057600 [Kribbella albertanoniae]
MRVRRWLGWMLRACRTLGTDTSFRNRSVFARAWPDGDRVQAVHVSTIQRWEAGLVVVPRDAIKRYEELLHLPTGQLTAVFDLLPGLTRHPRPLPTATSGDLQQLTAHGNRAGVLLDQVCSPAIVTGAQWDELTGLLTQWPAAFLPPRMWEEMAQRLLMEMLVADGTSWAQRYEALARLFNHPTGGTAAIDACASAAGLRHHQAMTSTVAALGASDHSDSIAAMVSQVHNPTNDRALAGAVAGLAETVWRGRLNPAQRGQVLAVLQPLAGSGDTLDAWSTNLVQRLTTTPPVRRAPAAPDDARRNVVDRVTSRAIAQVDGPDPAEYDVLGEVVHCLLFHQDPDSQLAASFTLAATPYRRPLAAALRQELGATLAGPAGWSTTVLAALRALGGESELRLAERIVTAAGIPGETVRVAAFAIAHLGGEGSDTSAAWWQNAISQQLARPTDLEILRGLAYSAGITGRRAALEQLRADPRTPYDSQAAATWWLDLPGHVLISAHS